MLRLALCILAILATKFAATPLPTVNPTRDDGDGKAPSDTTAKPSLAPTDPSENPTKSPSVDDHGFDPALLPALFPALNPDLFRENVPSLGFAENTTNYPSRMASMTPTEPHSDKTTDGPSGRPSDKPSAKPSKDPTTQPTKAPTADPSKAPTGEPTFEPTLDPTGAPTKFPSSNTSAEATPLPTSANTQKTCTGFARIINCNLLNTVPIIAVLISICIMVIVICILYSKYIRKDKTVDLGELEMNEIIGTSIVESSYVNGNMKTDNIGNGNEMDEDIEIMFQNKNNDMTPGVPLSRTTGENRTNDDRGDGNSEDGSIEVLYQNEGSPETVATPIGQKDLTPGEEVKSNDDVADYYGMGDVVSSDDTDNDGFRNLNQNQETEGRRSTKKTIE